MALNKNSKFGVAEGLIFEPVVPEETTTTKEIVLPAETSKNEKTETTTTSEYTITKEETRSQRLQIVVKPSINKKLDKLVKQKKIKSKNDLINFLLEDYLERN